MDQSPVDLLWRQFLLSLTGFRGLEGLCCMPINHVMCTTQQCVANLDFGVKMCLEALKLTYPGVLHLPEAQGGLLTSHQGSLSACECPRGSYRTHNCIIMIWLPKVSLMCLEGGLAGRGKSPEMWPGRVWMNSFSLLCSSAMPFCCAISDLQPDSLRLNSQKPLAKINLFLLAGVR